MVQSIQNVITVSYTHLDVYKRQDQVCETMIWDETIIIEDTKENTFVINNDNSREIINIKKESKIKIQRSYLIDRNIQVAGYTQ